MCPAEEKFHAKWDAPLSKQSRCRTAVIGDDYPALLRGRRRTLRRSEEDRQLYRRHFWRSEGLHGKRRPGTGRAVRRGLGNMRIQSCPTAAAINLKRLAAAFDVRFPACAPDSPDSAPADLRPDPAALASPEIAEGRVIQRPRMSTLSHPEMVGLGVSRDWHDFHCLSDIRQLRLPNTDSGPAELERMTLNRTAVVCFEATGSHEWRLWECLEAVGLDARRLPPPADQVVREKPGHSGQDGSDRRRTDRPVHGVPSGCSLPRETLRVLRVLVTKRRQLVDMHKRHALHCKADEETGAACEFEDIDADLREIPDRRIEDLEQRIKINLDSDEALAETVAVLWSVPGVRLVAGAMPTAEIPELGRISGEQSAAGLAPRRAGQRTDAREANDWRRPPVALMHPVPSRAFRLESRQRLEGLR